MLLPMVMPKNLKLVLEKLVPSVLKFSPLISAVDRLLTVGATLESIIVELLFV